MGIMNSNIAVGLGVAAAATILAPVLLPVVAGVGRPLAKSLLKGGLMLYEKGREAVAVAGETAEDMIAEIRAEDAQRRSAAGQAGPDAEAAGQRAPQTAQPAMPGAAGEAAPPLATVQQGNGAAI